MTKNHNTIAQITQMLESRQFVTYGKLLDVTPSPKQRISEIRKKTGYNIKHKYVPRNGEKVLAYYIDRKKPGRKPAKCKADNQYPEGKPSPEKVADAEHQCNDPVLLFSIFNLNEKPEKRNIFRRAADKVVNYFRYLG